MTHISNCPKCDLRLISWERVTVRNMFPKGKERVNLNFESELILPLCATVPRASVARSAVSPLNQCAQCLLTLTSSVLKSHEVTSIYVAGAAAVSYVTSGFKAVSARK